MKLLSTLLSILLATTYSYASTSSPKAYEKLKSMYDSAQAPSNLSDLFLEIEKIKGCAGTTAKTPDLVYKSPLLSVINYETQDFGPNFPSNKLTGIALKEEKSTYISAYSFFNSYRSYIDKSGLNITGSTYAYEKLDCDYIVDSFKECSSQTHTDEVNITIKVNGNTIHYVQDDLIAYCWK